MDDTLLKKDPEGALPEAEDQVEEGSAPLVTTDRKEVENYELDENERVIRAVSRIPLTY